VLIHEMFIAQVHRTPNHVALTGAEQYTYAELDRVTNALAHRLRQAGARTDSIIGCWAHDSVTTVIEVLSVLKAGAAYLLLDPYLPAQRLRYMITDAAPLYILADTEPDALDGRPVLLMEPGTDRDAPPDSGVTPDSLAYVAYTSGSTGRPKGVQITHAAVANHAVALRDQFALRPGDRLPLMAPTAFDMATEEMLPPLVSGCTLLAAGYRNPTMAEFTADVLAARYTVLNIPAPLWHQWTTYLRCASLSVPAALRLLIVGSDKIYTSRLHEWKALPGADRVRWVAAYGVTEATVTSLLYLSAAQDDLSDEPLVPIGTPLANTSAHVVGEDGRKVRQGEVGELWLGGVGLARGYLGMPERTAEQFPQHRFYRTGDLVRQRDDGVIVWLGRQDAQIKINGLRIEPAEIEAIIQEHPAVADAVVVHLPSETPEAPGQLRAYVEPGADTVESATLRDYLADRLHPLMVPDEIVIVERIPLNASGKVDRGAVARNVSESVL
jgi:amino acid adenylation domain-containing protein